MLTIISGLLSATAGIFWFAMFAFGRVRMPVEAEKAQKQEDEKEVLLASAG